MNDTGILAAIIVAALLIVFEMPSSPQNYKNELHSIADSLSKCASNLYRINLTLSLILRELTEMNTHNRNCDADAQHAYSNDILIHTEED